MSTLLVGTTTDFTGQDLTGTTAISFTNTGEDAVASFSADQFGLQISTQAVVTGSAGINTLVVSGNLDVAVRELKFLNWGPEDRLILNGTAGNDSIGGALVFSTIYAGDGDDFIQTSKAGGAVFAGAGDDTIAFNGRGLVDGGDGVDYLEISAPLHGHLTINISDGGGGRNVGNGTTVMNVEALSFGGGAGNDLAVGGALSDLLGGGSGNDSLYGGGGDDFIVGGSGHSVLNGGSGNDTIYSSGFDHIDGGSGVDSLVLYATGLATGVSINLGDGGGGRNIGNGTTIANIEQIAFNGTAAADYVIGGAKADLLNGNEGSDLLIGGGGRDVINGGSGGDFLGGGAGADSLSGGADGDRLQGGAGADTLSGGSGPDSFVYNALVDSNAINGVDRITDFTQGSDTIDLSDFHVAGHPGQFHFTFIGTAAFSHTAGELSYAIVGADTLIKGDVNGDGVADFTITLTGNITLTGSDFIL